MQNNLSESELNVMRRVAGLGPSYIANTAEDKLTLAGLQKKGFVAKNTRLTEKGWKALQEVDDDKWTD